ncbi:sigma-54-dependent transcriptional regulator [Chlamydiota bacterium]
MRIGLFNCTKRVLNHFQSLFPESDLVIRTGDETSIVPSFTFSLQVAVVEINNFMKGRKFILHFSRVSSVPLIVIFSITSDQMEPFKLHTTASPQMQQWIQELHTSGAYFILVSPLNPVITKTCIKNALDKNNLIHENNELHFSLTIKEDYEGMLGASVAMKKLFYQLSQIAPGSPAIHITGEKGVGKEYLARIIHQLAQKLPEEFRVIDCATVEKKELIKTVDNLQKGNCNKTLFLNDIDALSLDLQMILSRFLLNEKYTHSSNQKRLQLISSATRDVAFLVKKEQFRKDLYYSVCTGTFLIPPLRTRPEDIRLLAEYFMKKYTARFKKEYVSGDDAFFRSLILYSWPGNVAELDHVIEQVICLHDDGGILTEEMLPKAIKDTVGLVRPSLSNNTTSLSLKDMEKRQINHVLELCSNNVGEAAQKLGIGQATLYRKIKQFRKKREA